MEDEKKKKKTVTFIVTICSSHSRIFGECNSHGQPPCLPHSRKKIEISDFDAKEISSADTA